MGETIDASTDEDELSEIADRIETLVDEEFGSDATVRIYANDDTLDVQIKPTGVVETINQEYDVGVASYSDFKFTVHTG